MSKPLAGKLAAACIALAVMAGAFIGAIGASPDGEAAKAGDAGAQLTLEKATIAPLKIQADRGLLDDARIGIGEKLSSAPADGAESTLFTDDFEDDVVDMAPDNPPWETTTAIPFYRTYGYDNFENCTAGQNPLSPWITNDGTTLLDFWHRDCEDTTTGQDLSTGYFDGYGGGYRTFAGDATLTSQAVAGTPAGRVYTGFTGGTQSAFLDEGADTGVDTSYFGPYDMGTSPSGIGYVGFWFRCTTTATQRIDFEIYDYANGVDVAYFVIYGGILYHDQGGLVQVAGVTWAINTWYEFFVRYDSNAQTYTVYWNNVAYAADSPFADPAAVNPEACLFIGGEWSGNGESHVYVDNFCHFLPPTGGAHVVNMVNTWSDPDDGGTMSVWLDQNAYATESAFTELSIAAPYCWDAAGLFFTLRTDTAVADSNGATVWARDFMGANAMGLRISGGQFQYYTAGAWTNIGLASSASTNYKVEMWMSTLSQIYYAIYINTVEYAVNAPIGATCGGLKTVRLEGTVSTQSEVYFDYVYMEGDGHDSWANVTDNIAHAGAQSAHMYEGGSNDWSRFYGTLTNTSYSAGRVGFWFRADAPMGAGIVYLLDTTGAYAITQISLGADISMAGTGDTPGEITYVDGDGLGGGWLVAGPTFTAGTWNHLEIEYDCTLHEYTPYWNGVADAGAPYVFLENASADAGRLLFIGDAPSCPQNFYYDDVTFWADTRPMAVSDFSVDQYGQGLAPYTTLFNEGFSTGIADANWIGDDAGTGTDVTCSQEWWEVVEAAGDTGDILVGNYNTPPSTQSVQFIDCDDDWTGQYAIAKYNGGNNWFDLTSYASAHINLSMYGAGFGNANEGWRLEITTNSGSGWVTALEQVGATAIHNWQAFNYEIPTASMTNQFGFRINVAGSAATDIGTFDDIILKAAGPGPGNLNDNTLNWTLSPDDGAGDNDVVGYNIFRSDISSGPWDLTARIAQVPAGTATYRDLGRGAADSTYWWYVVRAYDAIGEETNVYAVQEPGAGANLPPVANAGPDQVVNKGIVTFDGSGSSDPDGTIASYQWDFTYNAAPQTLAGTAPTFDFQIPGVYTVTLTVTDNLGATGFDTMTVTVNNIGPTANPGPDQSVNKGIVTFDGSGSFDPDGTIASYSWTFTYNAVPQSLVGVAPTFDFQITGVYTVTLTVMDNDGAESTPDTMTVTVNNQAPTANAGADVTDYVDFWAMFMDSGSTDPDGTITSYEWTFMYDGSPQLLTGAMSGFMFQMPGVYTVTLTVTDNDGATDTDTMTVTANLLTQNIAYNAGWNLISVAVNTEGGKPLATVFADEWSNIQAVQYYDTQSGAWKLYDRAAPAWMNSLKSADETKGYWVYFNGAGDGQLTVTGKAIGWLTNITLTQGWNLIGYPSGVSELADTVLAGTSYDGLQRFDGAALYNLVDMLGTEPMVPGCAYWVHVPANTVCTVLY